MNEKVSRTAERIWKFLTGESLNLKEAGEKIVLQAAEAPTRQEQIARLEYAKHIWEEQLEGVRFHWRPFIMLTICCSLFLVFFYRPVSHFFPILQVFSESGALIIGCPVLGFLLGFVLYQSGLERAKSRYRSEIERCNTALIALGVQGLSNQDQFFTRLVTINFNYLDLYYRQTKNQANKSFWVSVAASIAGFGMVISGIFLLYMNAVSSGYVTVASGAISEFVAAVFFYLYNRTILSMSQYHQKLVITQNVSLALKTAETLPDSKKADAREKIIEQLTKDVNAYLSAARLPTEEPASSRTRRQRSQEKRRHAHGPVNNEDPAPAVPGANR
jgi:hypothetical protein